MITILPQPNTPSEPSYVLHERAARYQGAGVGSLSVKMFFGGRAIYTVGRARYSLEDGAYLVLNNGREYAIEIDAAAPVESFCVFFGAGFAERVRRDLATSDNHLLDEPHTAAAPMAFFERTYPYDASLAPALLDMRRSLAAFGDDPAWLGERFHDLAARLLCVHAALDAEIAAVPAARPATRTELYRRLHIARDYIAASLDQPLTLDDIADVAGLSPNHLLRTFRRLFGVSPHQYVVEQRLERARSLLARTELPVTEICHAVGFSSLGAFSWLFRTQAGVSPSEYRRQTR